MELLVLDRREFQAMLLTTPRIGVKMLDGRGPLGRRRRGLQPLSRSHREE